MILRHIPNIISVFRILLVWPVVYCILQGNYDQALWLFLIAGISDGVDGYLAKHFRWQSRLGSILDPIADKLLIVCSYAAVAWVGLIPLWLWITIFLRDFIIVTGGLAYHFLIGKFEMAPSLISKFNTVMQIALLLVVLSLQITQVPAWVTQWMVFLTLVTVVLSGLDYVSVWGRKAVKALRKSKT